MRAISSAVTAARSTVRKLLGVGFPGEPSRNDTLMGEMKATASPEEIAATVAEVGKTHQRFWLRPFGEGVYSVVVPAAEVGDRATPPTIEDVQTAVARHRRDGFRRALPRWLSRFGDATRLAERYRVGRVLLAGDAAHIHPPIGGQGLNLGVQDAFNLGWKLAAQVRGWAPDTPPGHLPGRTPPGRRGRAGQHPRPDGAVVHRTGAAGASARLLTELMDFDEVNRHLIEKITAIGIRYDFGGGPDLLGRRLRDIEVKQGTPLRPAASRPRPAAGPHRTPDRRRLVRPGRSPRGSHRGPGRPGCPAPPATATSPGSATINWTWTTTSPAGSANQPIDRPVPTDRAQHQPWCSAF